MLSKIQCGALAALLAVAALAGCTRIIRKGPLIDRYKAAECIPVKSGSGSSPPRIWNYTLTTREGVTAHISGAQIPLSRVIVRYTLDGREKVAANPGEYIYPVDVRFDGASGRLYTKASGIAVLGGHQTWLFEYDLNGRQQTGRERVDPNVLPQECQIK